jgi:hypothetical protein
MADAESPAKSQPRTRRTNRPVPVNTSFSKPGQNTSIKEKKSTPTSGSSSFEAESYISSFMSSFSFLTVSVRCWWDEYHFAKYF